MSSRIIVKNLPKHLTIERFKSHFSKKFQITDAKLVHTREGVFRRFGYIGFKTEKDARDAVNYFHNTYLDTSRMVVELAVAISDNNALARPWSKHSRGSSAYEKMQSNVNNNIKQSTNTTTPSPSTAVDGDIIAKASESGVVEDVEKLNEFMQVMQPRSQTRTWGNDDVAPNAATASLALPSMVKSKEDINYQDLGEVEAKKLEEEEEALLLDLEAIEKEKLNTAAHNQQLSDLDYFKSKMTGSLDAVEEEVEKVQIVSTTSTTTSSSTKKPDEAGSTSNAYNPASSSATHATTNITAAAVNSDSSPLPPPPPLPMFSIVEEDEEPPPADLIADTGRLLVQNISYLTTTDELTTLFAKYGPLSEVHIPIEKSSKRSLGYAFVMFLLPEHAVKAFIELDGSIFQGRILTVLPAKEKPRPKDEVELESLSFKERRAREQKKNAAKTEYSWNSLFMNSDAVADAISAKLGVRKSDILDPSSENMAVRLALAETQILNETKEYLEEEGVCLDAFAGKSKDRSKTIILVKNITFTTTEEEIDELFGKFGLLLRLVIPPTRTIALIEFAEANEAKAAFRHLAYSKFKSLPLYLEWAPINTFTKEPKAKSSKLLSEDDTTITTTTSAATAAAAAPTTSEDVKKILLNDTEKGDNGEGEDDTTTTPTPVATLFVKNLNFDTTEPALKEAFIKVGGLQSVRIVTKPDKKNAGGKPLSMGFGFLEFQSRASALQAVKTMQGFKLDGHALELKFSNAAAKSSSSGSAGIGMSKSAATVVNKGTKLIVRNIPFEATKRDIQQLFRSFGQVKSVRVPSKMDGTHRGFGFVDFLTRQEAKSAFESLSATHLYGRHLVIEWAQDDESVDALRAKTNKRFMGDEGPANAHKRNRVQLGSDGGAMEE